MLTRFIIIATLFLCGVSTAAAETVSRREARGIASSFFKLVMDIDVAKPTQVYNGRDLTTANLFPPFYVFDSPSGGFVIISAENKAFPILGYSYSGVFDAVVSDGSMADILRSYARDIELIRYDARIPCSAIACWNNLEVYFKDIYEGLCSDEFVSVAERTAFMLRNATEFDDLDTEISDGAFDISEDLPSRSADKGDVRSLSGFLDNERPEVDYLGGGHFKVSLNNGISLVNVYDMRGVRVESISCRDHEVIIKLDSVPSGFYIVALVGENGKRYGVKLYK